MKAIPKTLGIKHPKTSRRARKINLSILVNRILDNFVFMFPPLNEPVVSPVRREGACVNITSCSSLSNTGLHQQVRDALFMYSKPFETFSPSFKEFYSLDHDLSNAILSLSLFPLNVSQDINGQSIDILIQKRLQKQWDDPAFLEEWKTEQKLWGSTLCKNRS